MVNISNFEFSGRIYKIVFPNGKHYIGCTTNLDKRKKQHRHNASVDKPLCIVHKAIKKFNMIDTFELIVIDNSAKSKEEMFEKEIFYIQQYNSHIENDKGYNMTLGGDGNHGYVFTKSIRKKMRQRRKEFFENNPKAREKISQRQKAYYENNPEAREKMSQITKAHYQNNPEAGKENGQKLKLHYQNNPEAREKMSQITKAHYQNNPEAREKMSQITKAHYQNNPEAGKVHGEKMKAHYQNNPEAGKVHGEKMKAHFQNNPEAREKISQIKKAHFQNNPEAKRLEKNRKLFKVFRKDTMEFIKEFEYQFEAIEYIQKEFDVNVLSSKISDVLNKNRKSTQGFVFEYI